MLTNQLRIALRTLRTQRAYTLLNVVGLTVGMAGGLLIFLFLRHHLSTDRHHAHYERIFRVDMDIYLKDGSIEYNPESPPPVAQVLRTDYPQVEQAAFLMMFRDLTVGINGSGGRPPRNVQEHQGVGAVEPEWFDIMDYRWLRGDPKTALRSPNKVVLTESWAKRYFGDTNPVGQVLRLNNKVDAMVTGLLAEPPATTDTDLGLFVSASTLKTLDPTYDLTDWSWSSSTNRLYVLLRNADAAPALGRLFPALAKKHFGTDAPMFRLHLQPMREFHFDVVRDPGHAIRVSLLWSLGVVGVLLIVAACINFINLATAQSLRRRKEVGIRKTLGSTRWQLVGQFLLETALIVIIATLLAVSVVAITLPWFNQWLSVDLSLRIDGPMLGFIALLIGLVTGLAGGYPAAVLSGFAPASAFRGAASTGNRLLTKNGSHSVRQTLIVVQFGVCQVLVIGALVVANQMRYMQQTELGFQKENVVIVNLPSGQKANQDAFKQQLLADAAIESVSLTVLPPTSSLGYGGSFKFEGRTDWEKYPILERLADADYLKTYGMKLLAGRNITPGDTIRDYVINETLLHKLGFQTPEQALGKKLQYYLSNRPLPIVGVVADFHQKSLRDEIGPCVIAPYAPWYQRAGIRLAGSDPAKALQRIRQTWQKLFPNEVFAYQYVDEQVAKLYETETLTARLINVFTGIAILICGLGLSGLVSFVVGQRTKEIGIRKVLGASVASLVALLSIDFLKLVLVAVILSSPVAYAVMNRWLQDFAYRTNVAWWVFVLAGLLSIGIALLTVSFQSIRAALMNPVKSLRSE